MIPKRYRKCVARCTIAVLGAVQWLRSRFRRNLEVGMNSKTEGLCIVVIILK